MKYLKLAPVLLISIVALMQVTRNSEDTIRKPLWALLAISTLCCVFLLQKRWSEIDTGRKAFFFVALAISTALYFYQRF